MTRDEIVYLEMLQRVGCADEIEKENGGSTVTDEEIFQCAWDKYFSLDWKPLNDSEKKLRENIVVYLNVNHVLERIRGAIITDEERMFIRCPDQSHIANARLCAELLETKVVDDEKDFRNKAKRNIS